MMSFPYSHVFAMDFGIRVYLCPDLEVFGGGRGRGKEVEMEKEKNEG